MPSNASEESAAKPPGPVMCTDMPSGVPCAISRTSSTATPRLSQPPALGLIGTTTWNAWPSSDGIGPMLSRSTPSMSSNRSTCPATAAASAGVAPSRRS